MNDRIKKVRKALNLTQQEFANRIGSVQNTITGYETGRRIPSNQVITLMCREFNISEEWLRTGEGGMFIKKEPQPLDKLLSELLGGETVTNEDRVLVKNFLELPENSRKAVIKFVQKCAGELSAPDTDKEISVPTSAGYEAEARAEAEEYYREILEEKRRAAGGSASSASNGAKLA